MIVNYYTILGVPQGATEREIKLAFKRLAIQYHPDKNPGNLAVEEKFKTVNEAYQVLSDPRKRELHDLRLQYAQQHERIRQQQRQEQDRYRQTREPASVRERHYRPIPKRRHFSRRDYLIVAGIFAFIILFSLSVSFVMNHVAARSRYHSALPYIERGQWSSAHSLLSEAINFKEEYADAYLRRAFIEMNIYQNYRAAVHDFEAAMKYGDTTSPQVHYHKGKCHFQLRQYGQAEQELTLALHGDPSLTLALFERGEIRLFFLNRYNLAVDDFSAFLATEPEGKLRHDALKNRGYGYYQLKRYRTALDDYEEAQQEGPADGKLHHLQGLAELALGNRRNACIAFVHAYNNGYPDAEQDLLRECVGK